jgi:hypothetical protein
LLSGTVLMITWMLNDIFTGQGQGRNVILGTHEDTMRLATRVFVGAIEMVTLARRFPHAVFAIGASAKTWKVDGFFDFFAAVARIGVTLAGRNVASGVRDRASICAFALQG